MKIADRAGCHLSDSHVELATRVPIAVFGVQDRGPSAIGDRSPVDQPADYWIRVADDIARVLLGIQIRSSEVRVR
jgi:hypothetical protein